MHPDIGGKTQPIDKTALLPSLQGPSSHGEDLTRCCNFYPRSCEPASRKLEVKNLTIDFYNTKSFQTLKIQCERANKWYRQGLPTGRSRL